MEIVIGYDLPFRASAFTTPDPMLRIRVGCRPGATHEDLLRVEAHGVTFIEAALLGMGAGARVPPRMDARPIDDVLRVGFGRDGLALEAPVVIDPSYVVVLLHKLLCLSELVQLESVAVELPGLAAHGPVPIVRRETSELPETHPGLPFVLEDERGGYTSTRTVTLIHAEPPSEVALVALRRGLRVWVSQALQGGFISPPMGRGDYFVSADDVVQVLDDEVIWGIENVRLDLDGMNGLLNFFTAYHDQVAALRGVVLE